MEEEEQVEEDQAYYFVSCKGPVQGRRTLDLEDAPFGMVTCLQNAASYSTRL